MPCNVTLIYYMFSVLYMSLPDIESTTQLRPSSKREEMKRSEDILPPFPFIEVRAGPIIEN
jgi:hypothetical protein